MICIPCYIYIRFLGREWKSRHPNIPRMFTEIKMKNSTFALSIPKQKNSTDCGLYMMEVIEKIAERGGINVDENESEDDDEDDDVKHTHISI